jgi:hypothetical protein
MKYCDTRQKEYINYNKHQYIREDLVNCYQKLCKGEDINNIIKCHRKVITSMELTGKNKNKYKTICYLEQYKNTKNKAAAIMVLTNTLSNGQYAL